MNERVYDVLEAVFHKAEAQGEHPDREWVMQIAQLVNGLPDGPYMQLHKDRVYGWADTAQYTPLFYNLAYWAAQAVIDAALCAAINAARADGREFTLEEVREARVVMAEKIAAIIA